MNAKKFFKIKNGENYRLISIPKTFEELKTQFDTKVLYIKIQKEMILFFQMKKNTLFY